MRPKEWFGVGILAVVGLLGLGYIGATAVEQPAPMALEVAPGALAAASPASQPPAAPTEVVVHVVGAVKAAAVVRLPPGARVAEAIAKAGGATQNADLESLNLAAKLEDGTQLYVPRKGAAPEAAKVAATYQGGKAAPSRYASAGAKAQVSKSDAKPGPKMVNLNTATQAQLESLPGVGPATAKKIMAYRRERGGFTSVDEMLAVKGIGPKKLADMKPYLRL